MTLVRRLVGPLLALTALLLLPAAATAECTPTALPDQRDRPSIALAGSDAPLLACAATVLQVSPNPLEVGAVATFDGSSSFGDSGTSADIARYAWEYGDGATATTLAGDPTPAITTHAYASRGHYRALLITYDSGGLEITRSPLIDVFVGTKPVAALAAPPPVLRPGVAYQFDASGSYAPDAPDGSIVSYRWSWGDGSPIEVTATPTASHRFATGSSTAVSVTAVDDIDLTSDPASQPIDVHNQLPLVQLIATPATVQVGQQLTLDASGSSDADGSVVGYRWDLDANGSFETPPGTAPSTNPTVTAGPYPNPGTVYPRVKVFDDDGGSSVKDIPVTISSPPSSGGGGTSGGSGSGTGSGGGSTGGSGTGSGSSGGGGTSGGAGNPFAVSLSGAAIQKLKAALRRGIGLRVVTNRAATGTLAMTVSARDGKALRLPGRRGKRPVTIGTLRLALSAGRTAKPAIKLARGAAGALRRVKPRSLRVTIRGSLAAGTVSAAVVRVVLLRG